MPCIYNRNIFLTKFISIMQCYKKYVISSIEIGSFTIVKISAGIILFQFLASKKSTSLKLAGIAARIAFSRLHQQLP